MEPSESLTSKYDMKQSAITNLVENLVKKWLLCRFHLFHAFGHELVNMLQCFFGSWIGQQVMVGSFQNHHGTIRLGRRGMLLQEIHI